MRRNRKEEDLRVRALHAARHEEDVETRQEEARLRRLRKEASAEVKRILRARVPPDDWQVTREPSPHADSRSGWPANILCLMIVIEGVTITQREGTDLRIGDPVNGPGLSLQSFGRALTQLDQGSGRIAQAEL